MSNREGGILRTLRKIARKQSKRKQKRQSTNIWHFRVGILDKTTPVYSRNGRVEAMCGEWYIWADQQHNWPACPDCQDIFDSLSLHQSIQRSIQRGAQQSVQRSSPVTHSTTLSTQYPSWWGKFTTPAKAIPATVTPKKFVPPEGVVE